MSGIAKAIEIADVCKDSMQSFEVMVMAADIVQNASNVSQDELIAMLFKYSGTLTAHVASRLTHVLMSESEFEAMSADVEMFDSIGRDVFGDGE